MSDYSTAVRVAGVPCIAVVSLFLLTLSALAVFMFRKGVKISLPYGLLMIALATHLIFRIITFSLLLSSILNGIDAIMNRISWCSGCLVLVVLLVTWIEAVHSQFAHGSNRCMFWMRIAFLILSVLYTLGVLVPVIVAKSLSEDIFFSGGPGARIALEASLWTHNAFQSALALLFLVYGIWLVVLLQRAHRGEKQQTITVIAIAATIFVVYALPLGMFLIYPLGGRVPGILFFTLVYTLPSSLLSLVVIFLLVTYILKEMEQMNVHGSSSSAEHLLEDTGRRVPAAYDSDNF